MSAISPPASVCGDFVAQPCVSYTNCTMSGFIHNWTEFCCQPASVKDTRSAMLTVIGLVGITGTVCNIITISSFLYMYCFPQRIKTKFGQEFAMITEDPIFFLILHLSFCDLLYCIIGLATYWVVYYHGYFPYSEAMCKYSAFFRNTLAYADLNTLSLISGCFAWRRGRGRPYNQRYGRLPVLGFILAIWIFSLCLSSIVLTEVCGKFGYDAVHGKCHIIECEKCSENSTFTCPPGGVILMTGVGVPFMIVLVSYGLVYKSLREADLNLETRSQQQSVMILTFCYFIFILPIAIIEWLPEAVSNRAFISVSIYLCYWFVYVVNFFIYVIFWRRIRTVIILMLKDLAEALGLKTQTKTDAAKDSTTWWDSMQRLDQDH